MQYWPKCLARKAS